MNKSYYYGSAVITLAALILSVIISPSKNDVALMQLEDGNLHAAFEKYQSEAEKGDVSMAVAMPLSRLYLQYGDIDQAIAVMENFAAKNPTSLEACHQLGLLYKSAQRLDDYLENLKIEAKLSPSETVFQEMVNVSDFLGRNDIKLTALQGLIHSKGYTVRQEDYLTLATLFANQGDSRNALEVLKDIIAVQEYEVSKNVMDLTLQLLMENGYSDTAFSIASIYLDKHPNGINVADNMEIFRTKGRADLALSLATPFQKFIEKSVALQEAVVAALLVQGKEKQALDILEKQLEQKNLSGSLSETLLTLALKHKDTALLENLAAKVSLKNISEETLIQYAEMAIITQNKKLSVALYHNLGEAFFVYTPVLNTILQASLHPTTETMQELANIQTDPALNLNQKLVLLRLYAQFKQSAALLTLAGKLPVQEVLANLEAIDIAEIYLSSGNTALGIQRYSAARQTLKPFLRKIDAVLLFIAAGSNDTALFALQEKRMGKLDKQIIADSYTLAERYKNLDLTLALARKLYAHNATAENQAQLVDALLLGKHYGEALELLSPMIAEGKSMEQPYMDAVSGLVREQKIEQLHKHKATLFHVIDNLLMRSDVPEKENRDIAYLLLKMGYTQKAEEIFLALAHNKDAASPDAQALFALMGTSPNAKIREWLKQRATDTQEEEQAVWLTKLNAVGEAASTVSLIEERRTNLHSSDIADAYIEALILTKAANRDLQSVLKAELEKGTSHARYRKLTMLAVAHGMEKTAEPYLRHLLTVTPTDTDILKQLGLINFYKENYDEAERYIADYLKNAEGGIDMDSAYAEILWQKKSYKKADYYYARAAALIAKLPHKDFSTRMTEAHIFYRQGKIKEASRMYHALLKEQPDNKNLKSDLANILIEYRQFSEAEQLLTQ